MPRKTFKAASTTLPTGLDMAAHVAMISGPIARIIFGMPPERR